MCNINGVRAHTPLVLVIAAGIRLIEAHSTSLMRKGMQNHNVVSALSITDALGTPIPTF